jgi:hypothetical protein
LCHPDEASNASGWKDLGQRRASAAGSGFALLLSNQDPKGPLRDFQKTGTGFARAKLSGGQKPYPAARVARSVRMTQIRDPLVGSG